MHHDDDGDLEDGYLVLRVIIRDKIKSAHDRENFKVSQGETASSTPMSLTEGSISRMFMEDKKKHDPESNVVGLSLKSTNGRRHWESDVGEEDKPQSLALEENETFSGMAKARLLRMGKDAVCDFESCGDSDGHDVLHLFSGGRMFLSLRLLRCKGSAKKGVAELTSRFLKRVSRLESRNEKALRSIARVKRKLEDRSDATRTSRGNRMRSSPPTRGFTKLHQRRRKHRSSLHENKSENGDDDD